MLKLKRTYYDNYTSGELTLFKNNNDGNNNSNNNSNNNLKIELYTLELPYKDNQTNISCIPEGRYIVKRYKSPKFSDCFKIYDINKDDGGNYKEVNGRSDILIHTGNFIDETKGCILVGKGKQKGAFITDSKTALKILLDNIENEDELIIE